MNRRTTSSCTLALIAGAVAFGSAVGTANASLVQSMAFGDQLHGGILTIDFLPGPGAPIITIVAPILAVGPGHGRAVIPDPFGNPFPGAEFNVIGDTFLADWTLENFADASIIRAHFDLSNTISMFDDNSIPDTPGSFLGVQGVQYNPISTAPQEIFAAELTPWGDPKNAGDMYLEQVIRWPLPDFANPQFVGGLIYIWNDDTDIIPAPGALALLGLAGLTVARRRRLKA